MGVPIFHFHDSNIKRTAILEKAMYSSPFLCKRKLTELFAAHETPVCLRHSHTANKTGIATHRVTLSTATPKRPATESSVSKVLCIPAQPGKQRDTACLHAPQTAFPSSNKAFKKRGFPLPPQHDPVRTEGFLHWVQYSRVTLLLHKNCHILTVRMS